MDNNTYRTPPLTGVTPEIAFAEELAAKISEVGNTLKTGQRRIVIRNRKLHAPVRMHYEALGWIVALEEDDNHPRLRFRDASEPVSEVVVVPKQQSWWDPTNSSIKSFVYAFSVVIILLVLMALKGGTP